MSGSRPSVAVIYHFYPHYRKPVVEALARSTRADFTFIGDDHEYLHSIEPAKLSGAVRFRLAPTHHLFGPFMWQWGAIRWAVRPEFDTVIMHAVPHWPCTWIGGLLARLMGKRVFFWGHGYLTRPRGLKGLLRRLFYAVPTDHMFYSRLSKAYAVEAGWPAERLHVIYNSLDTVAQRSIREAWSPAQGRELRTRLFGDATVRHLLDMEASYSFVEDYSLPLGRDLGLSVHWNNERVTIPAIAAPPGSRLRLGPRCSGKSRACHGSAHAHSSRRSPNRR